MSKSQSPEFTELPAHEFRVPSDGTFSVSAARTFPPDDAPGEKSCEKKLRKTIDDLDDLQRKLYATDHHSVLCVFQAMDAAGKDSTIRAVFSGLNPAGFQVFSFKKPSDEELDHDFLWRTARRLPERGRIGVFNRSYYEEVLVVRVHPQILEGQRLPEPCASAEDIWEQRLESIRDHEKHLARNGTLILKFWLNVSREEQHARFLDRLETPKKNWKFSARDLDESERWADYMLAYEHALNMTSRPWAPWYAIPADDKPYMRWTVACILEDTLDSLDLEYPKLDADQTAELAMLRERLRAKG